MHRLMLLTGFLAGLLAAAFLVLLPNAPARAATPKQKAATCKFYADQQKLAGPKRAEFMAKCTSSKNDPRGGAAGASGGLPGSQSAPAEPEEEQQ
jgi:hypothetical protein